MAKWSKSQLAHFRATMKAKASEKAKAKPLESHYVDEQPAQQTGAVVDVNRIEDRAFRRGLFTGLQMVVDLLIRELR